MRKTLWLSGIAVALAALMAPPAWTQDVDKGVRKALEGSNPDNIDPNEIKGANWTFDFRFDHPEPIVVTTPGGEKEVYWYVVYTVTNTSSEVHDFIPTFLLYSNTGSLRRAGVYPTVFANVKQQRKIRFLENAVQMVGKVLPGGDNARTGVAIFAPLDRKTDHFTIFVGGLSGQYIERPLPGASPDEAKTEIPPPEGRIETVPMPNPDAKVLCLHKTLALEYRLPGDEWWKNQDQPLFVSKSWTWR